MTSVSTDRRFGVNSGKAVKIACKVATTTNITLSGEKNIDGISCVTNDRVLVRSQSTTSENGIWIVDTGSWSRSLDFDDPNDVTQGTLIVIAQGTTYGGTSFFISTSGDITPGDTPLSFSQLTGSSSANSSTNFRNVLINGNFDLWDYATSQTSSGYGSDNRWINANSGSTKTHSRQTFTLGQTAVPENPKYYSRTVVTTSAGASNYARKEHRIEFVKTLSGQNATLTFYAKADASKNIAVEFVQNFGTGGSPSAEVTAIGVTTVALTTSFAKYTVNVSLSSISGKTLGTNNNDYLNIIFWFDAGSSFNSRTNSLGQQSGTFDISQVQLEEGLAATTFEKRPLAIEIELCQRYFEKSWNSPDPVGTGSVSGAQWEFRNVTTGITQYGDVRYQTRKRTTPTATVYSWSAATAGKVSQDDASEINATVADVGECGFRLNWTNTVGHFGARFFWTASAEL